MFLGSPFGSGFNISSAIGGLNKLLGLVNKAMPMYQQMKPTISKIMDFAKNNANTISNKKSVTTKNTFLKQNNKISPKQVNSLPTFFN